ncbi:MAG: chromosome segregation protein SMC, partial [Desulfobulbus sp.]
MKIESLRLKNLNSLYGEWSIDFTVPEFTANGIFAITGPTGAGKSTLLDGICLALYGRTPRLDRINKGGNEVMSRGTGECAAEVVFSSGHGRFCCHFSHHRARKKADGRLADAKHEIADADSGKVLATKKREVARLVEQFTGMDFDRFTRSILLAQGGFAAFLQATPDKRAPVLEQITGTKIYSEISCRVHERLREEQKKLELLQAATQGISVLSAEEEQQLVCRHQVLEQQEKDMAGKAELIVAAIQWQSELASLEQELASCVKEAEEVQTAQAGFASKRKRLESGRRAAKLEAEFTALAARRQLQQQEQNALSKAERELP